MCGISTKPDFSGSLDHPEYNKIMNNVNLVTSFFVNSNFISSKCLKMMTLQTQVILPGRVTHTFQNKENETR